MWNHASGGLPVKLYADFQWRVGGPPLPPAPLATIWFPVTGRWEKLKFLKFIWCLSGVGGGLGRKKSESPLPRVSLSQLFC